MVKYTTSSPNHPTNTHQNVQGQLWKADNVTCRKCQRHRVAVDQTLPLSGGSQLLTNQARLLCVRVCFSFNIRAKALFWAKSKTALTNYDFITS